MLSQLLSSLAATRLGPRRLLAGATLLWSLFTLLTPSAAATGSPTVLILCRILLGLCEGAAFPCCFQILGASLPERRARNVSKIQFGVYAGTVCAFAITTVTVTYSRWENAFFIFGSAGFLWLALWWRHADLSHDGPAAVLSTPTSTPTPTSTSTSTSSPSIRLVLRMLTQRELVPIYIAHFTQAIAHFTALAWLPTFLAAVRESTGPAGEGGLRTSDSLLLMLPYLLMAAVTVAGGQAADALLLQGWERGLVRRLMTLLGLGGAALIMLFFLTLPPGIPSTLVLCTALGLSSLSCAGHEANKLDVVDARLTGVLQGISNTIAAGSGVVGVPMAAFATSVTGTWSAVWAMTAALYALGAAVFWFFGVGYRVDFGGGSGK